MIAASYGYNMIQKDLSIPEIKSLDQKEVSEKYAEEAYKALKEPLITDDSGLYLKGFNQFPGAYTKYVLQTIGVEGLHKLIDKKSVHAEWRCYAVYSDGKIIISSVGKMTGCIKIDVIEKVNTYDDIFYPNCGSRSLSEYSLEEKCVVSHRRNALDKIFIDILKKG